MRVFGPAIGRWLLLFGLCVMGGGLGAQERVRPERWSQLWLDIGVRKKLTDRLKLLGEGGFRTGDELTRGRQFYLEGALRYKLNKYFSAGFEQRAAFRAIGPNRHRTGLLLLAGERFGRTTLDYRFAYQHVWRERGARRDFVRNRFGVEYDIKGFQFDPEVSLEFFTALGPERAHYDAVRWKVGTSWKPMKGHRVSFAILHDREQNRRRPDHRWVFAFGYVIDLDKA